MKAVGFALLLAAMFALGFSWRDIQSGQTPSINSFRKLVGASSPTVGAEQEFKQAYNHVQTTYYKPVKPLDLKYAGISGMMASLGDPHTMFLTPQVARRFDMDTQANYVGVGARLSPYLKGGETLGAIAVVVFESGPAYDAGLRRGDVIASVDGKKLDGLTINQIVNKIMGEEGTVVHLGVLKGGKGEPVAMPVRRAHVTTPTVESQYFPASHVGYLLIESFSTPTAEQFDKELAKLEQNPLKGLVIDLRGDPGGFLDTAVNLLSRFKAGKLVVSMRMKDGSLNREYTLPGLEHDFRYPIALLINGDTASAAEIFSGVLHEYRLATLVGTHSYGKASVQQVFAFKDGSSGKITIARYYLPSGADIGRKVDADGVYLSGGLQPDVEVEAKDLLPEDLLRQTPQTDSDLPQPATDNQLAKAIQVVLAKSP